MNTTDRLPTSASDGAGADELRDLAPAATLTAIATARRTADAAEARLLAAVVHWVDLHPVLADATPATWSGATLTGAGDAVAASIDAHLASTAATAGGPPAGDAVAGPGTPSVTETAVAEIGAALGLPYATALGLVADAVELCFRLPRLWALVQSGVLQAWRARRVAQETTRLSPDAAGFVDRHLAVLARHGRLPAGRIRPLVHEALHRCDPDTAAGIEEAALTARGVWFDHRESTATSRLTATLDTLDALDLDATITDLAALFGRLGDTSHLDVRRAHALGMLADPQRTLDLTHDTRTAGTAGTVDSAQGAADETGSSGNRPWGGGRRRPGSRAVLYLHLTPADLATGGGIGTINSTGTGPATDIGLADLVGGGWVEQQGPATLALIREWLQRSDTISIRPVLDPRTGATADRQDATATGTKAAVATVDRHDPPEAIREAVILRDQHCVFPGCTTTARACDLDHIRPYEDPDTGGPPGQTSLTTLACLCRRHHRLKTHTGWRYHRRPDGGYAWTSPTGQHYTSPPPEHPHLC